MEITYNNIKSAINRLKPYKLYGRKEQIENIRDMLPEYVEAIEVPEGYLPDREKMILIDERESYPVGIK